MPSIHLHTLLADTKYPVLYCLERDCSFPVVCQSVRATEKQIYINKYIYIYIYLVLARILWDK